jgi:hypothetical protein
MDVCESKKVGKLTLSVCHVCMCVCMGIGEHKSSKMAHFVFKCNKEDYLSLCMYVGCMYVCMCMDVCESREADFVGMPCLCVCVCVQACICMYVSP